LAIAAPTVFAERVPIRSADRGVLLSESRCAAGTQWVRSRASRGFGQPTHPTLWPAVSLRSQHSLAWQTPS